MSHRLVVALVLAHGTTASHRPTRLVGPDEGTVLAQGYNPLDTLVLNV